MKEYNKEKLNEYEKELFALCLERGFSFQNMFGVITVYVHANEVYTSYITKDLYSFKFEITVPIWELIEKVKAL